MSNSFNLPYQYPPMNYSGVTIQVANPTMNATPFGPAYMPHQHQCCANHTNPMLMQPQVPFNNIIPQQQQPILAPQALPNAQTIGMAQPYYQPQAPVNNYQPNPNQTAAYPAQYYLNNYNYVQGEPVGVPKVETVTEKNVSTPESVAEKEEPIVSNKASEEIEKPLQVADDKTKEALQDIQNSAAQEAVEPDLTKSKEIIEELDTRATEQKELEKNGKKTKVVALTNEYIMSLENYLNNPNADIRLMASKEILTRLDEDRTRFDDAALNALINKMLQDPEKLVRIAALSALSSQLASGNDFTVQLLHQIQQNPNSDKEDVLQVADILLKMSTQTEERFQQTQQVQQAVIPQEAQ